MFVIHGYRNPQNDIDQSLRAIYVHQNSRPISHDHDRSQSPGKQNRKSDDIP